MGTLHRWTATIGGQSLHILEGRLTLDAAWAPYIQATLQIVKPSRALRLLLDPRQSPPPRVVVTMTTTVPGASSPATTKSFNLGLRERRPVDGATIELSLAGDEALLQDYRPFNTFYIVPGTATLTSIITAAIPGASVFGDTGSVISDDPVGNRNLWEFLDAYVVASNGVLYCDSARAWYFNAQHFSFDPVLPISYGTNLVDIRETVTREGDYANAIAVEYAADVTRVSASAGHSKGLVIDRHETTYSSAYANEAAQIRTNRLRAGRTLEIVALADYSVTAGRALTLTEDDGTVTNTEVASVTFDYPQAEMSIEPMTWYW